MNLENLKEMLKKTINLTDEKLKQSENWKMIYEKRANSILENEKKQIDLKKKFYKRKPFTYYETISKINKNKMNVSVRYLGQEVAEITVESDGEVTISTDKYNDRNKNNFNCNIKLDNVSWNKSEEAKKFRKFFIEREALRNNKNKNNEEHRIESSLLTEFLKENSEDKLLCGIQPVTFVGFRFPMPIAITASGKEPELGGKEGSSGGNIDILARTKGRKITVIELKDENKPQEDINKVLEQATAYAIFILKLLRSNSGEKWYKIFGFTGNIPKKIKIRVCSAMPLKKDGTYDTFETFTLPFENDMLEYHWIYFKEENKKIKEIESSL